MFDGLFRRKATAQANQEMQQHLGDGARAYAQAAPTLRALFYTDEQAAPLAEKLVMREDLPGLKTVAMFDMPSTFGNVNPEYVKLWGVPAQEILDRAVANGVREPTAVEKVNFGPGVAVTVITGGHPWVGAQALALENSLGPLSRFGALVAVPHRQEVFAHAIHDKSAGTALGMMIKMVNHCLSEGPPKPLSKNLFWYRRERYDCIHTWMQGDMPVQMHADDSEFLCEVARPLGFAPSA
jgi:hypothetical protein